MNLNDLLAAYLAERLVQPATAQQFRAVLRLWQQDVGLAEIEQITKSDLLRWRDLILGRASPTTWNNYLRHLRVLGNYGCQEGLVAGNPFASVRFVRVPKVPPKAIPLSTVAEALTALEQDTVACQPGWFWAAVVGVLYTTGIRRRQLVGLRWRDVDFAQKRMTLRADTSKTRMQWTIPLREDSLLFLNRVREQTEGRIGPLAAQDARQVFNVTLFNPRYRGGALTEMKVSGFFRRLSEKLGQPISSHKLRHTFASQLAPHGDLKALQTLLGHTDVRTTLGYVTSDLQQMRALIDRLAVAAPPEG